MTLRRLILLIFGAILILTPAHLQQNIPIPLAVLCVCIGCLIGAYPDLVACIRAWKEGSLNLKKNRAIIEAIIYEAIWTTIILFDFVFDWFGREKILIPILFGFLFAVYLVYTHPLSAEDMAGRNPFVFVRILNHEKMPDVTKFPLSSKDSTQKATCIFTQASSELQDITQFLNQYPVNRRSQFGIGFYTNPVEDSCRDNEGILLEMYFHYKAPNGSLTVITYRINSQGDVYVDNSPCGIGRFGQQNQAFYEALLRLFAEKSRSPLWEVS